MRSRPAKTPFRSLPLRLLPWVPPSVRWSWRPTEGGGPACHRENARAVPRRRPQGVNGSSGLTGDQVSGTGVVIVLHFPLFSPLLFACASFAIFGAWFPGLLPFSFPLPSPPLPVFSLLGFPCCSFGRVLSVFASFVDFPSLLPSLSLLCLRCRCLFFWLALASCALFLWCSGAPPFSRPVCDLEARTDVGLVVFYTFFMSSALRLVRHCFSVHLRMHGLCDLLMVVEFVLFIFSVFWSRVLPVPWLSGFASLIPRMWCAFLRFQLGASW